MSQDSELVRLENFVSKLLEQYSQLKDENGRLNRELKDREETIVDLKGQLDENNLEKLEIGERVSSIIGKIEDWESTLGGGAESNGVPPNDPSRQGKLFADSASKEEEGED